MKHMDIIQEVKDELQDLVLESIKKGKSGLNICDLNIFFNEKYIKIGLKILKGIYEQIEDEIYKSKARKDNFDVVKKQKRKILTSLGTLEYTRRLYKNKKTNESIYLFDEKVSLLKNKLLTDDAKIKVIEEAIDSSYRKGGINASVSDYITKMTVKNILRDITLPSKDYTVIKKKIIDYLYIDADEDHISLQKEDDSQEINKLIYVYEGVVPEAPRSKRYKLINPHYFGGICKNTKENTLLWEKVRRYICDTYDIKHIKKIYLGGDGGMWIKEGKNLFNNIEFVMDEFHIKKYAYKMTLHLKDSNSDAIDELYNVLRSKNIDNLYKFINKLYCYVKTTEDKNRLEESSKYFINNFDSIVKRLIRKEHIVGCSAEGHVSHLLASRMSSRPMGWSIDGANKITKLRLYRANGNSIYDLVKANTEASKIFTLKREEDDLVYSAEFIMSDINKHNKKVKGFEDYTQYELTDRGKQMLALNHVKL